VPHPRLALALLAALGADPAPAPRLLPRSSIAAVVARRGELGLDDGQVKQLEERDAALQRQLAEIRERFGQAQRLPGGQGRPRPAGPPDGSSPLPSPAERARDPAAGPVPGGGGGRGRHAGGRRGAQGGREDRAGELQRRLDDADTEAWLAAESVLAERQRDPARAVAERYREALADEREAARQKAK
jgi:hypothetical protein